MKGSDFSVMTSEHIDAVSAIERQSFIHPWPAQFFIDELNCDTAFSSVILVQQETSAGQTDPLEVQSGKKEVAAYICLRRIIDEIQLFKIAVHPEYRNLGLASRLLDESFNAAGQPEASTVLLEVRISNRPAINFYRKHGFNIIGKRPGYYAGNREDALVMEKTLRRGYEYPNRH